MNVSPAGAGEITSDEFTSQPTVYPTVYSCSETYTLTAVPLTNSGYTFEGWAGDYDEATNPLSVSVSGGIKSVTASFKLNASIVDLTAAKNMIDSNRALIVLDVRETNEFEAGHILCAANYPWNSGVLASDYTQLNAHKDDDILVHCKSGFRSAAAAAFLIEKRFTAIYDMTDGMDGWTNQGWETVTDCGFCGGTCSLPQLALAGPDQMKVENSTVTLDGSGSLDPDGGALTYLWTQTEGQDVSLSDETAANPSFVAPAVQEGGELFVFQLAVTDDENNTDTDSIVVTVTWNDDTPTADAGLDQTATEGALVELDGSASSDPEDDIVSYAWIQIDGTSVTLSSTAAVNPTFDAPEIDTGTITLTFELTIEDAGGQTSTDTVTITIRNSGGGGGGGCFISSLVD